MWKYSLILLLLISALGCSNQSKKVSVKNTIPQASPYQPWSSFNGDTIAYLNKNFIDNKEYYKHQKVSVLLDHLELPVKNYLCGPDDSQRMLVYSVSLEFFSPVKTDRRIKDKQDAGLLIIEWEKPFPEDSIAKLVIKNKRAWTKDEVRLIGKQIISNITTIEYNFKK